MGNNWELLTSTEGYSRETTSHHSFLYCARLSFVLIVWEQNNVVYLSAVGILGCKEKKLSHCVKRTSNYMKNFGGTLESYTELFNWDFKV